MFSKVKKSILLIMSLVLLIGVPMLVKADECNYGLCRTQEATGGLLPRTLGGAKNVPELVGVVISLVLGFLGIVFFLLVFYAGLIWMTARGDEGKIEDSKKTIEAAVIGLVIIMAAYALTQFVFTNLGAANKAVNILTRPQAMPFSFRRPGEGRGPLCRFEHGSRPTTCRDDDLKVVAPADR
jgi:hypothetical protein